MSTDRETPLCDAARQFPLHPLPTDKQRAARYIALAMRLERDRALLRDALVTLHESKAMNAWGHNVARIALAATEDK